MGNFPETTRSLQEYTLEKNFVEPLVSIVTPTYNSAKFIRDTIYSVKQQTFENWEHIVVDDGSTDRTLEIVRELAESDPRIKLFEQNENFGAAVARNIAIHASRGRFIAFLDSDDLWAPQKLEVQIVFMLKHQIALCYSSYFVINKEGQRIGRVFAPEKVVYSDLLKQCRIGCLTVVYDTFHCGKIEMPLIRKRQDLGLWLRIIKKTGAGFGVQQDLGSYRAHSDSLSANKATAAMYTWKLYREVERLSFVLAVYYFSHYAFNGLFRRRERL